MFESEKENQVWDKIIARDGVVKTAYRISRRRIYREYVQHWPYDFTEPRLSLDLLHEAGFDPKGADSPEEAYADEEFVQEFLSTLTKKQRVIAEELMKGNRPKDIFKNLGYHDTGGIRYHKWIMRKKWAEFTGENTDL